MIRARAISKNLGGRLLFGGLDLEVGLGESVAVVGPSGSGKTTLLRILGGLLEVDGGELAVDGRPLTGPSKLGATERAGLRAERIGFVFQGDNLLRHLTVLQNAGLVAAFRRTKLASGAVADAVRRVGLQHVAGQRGSTLSGGEAQRTAVARAIAQHPALLLCDEPTGSLDETSAKNVIAVLLDAFRELRCALVVATHDESLASSCARRLVLGGPK